MRIFIHLPKGSYLCDLPLTHDGDPVTHGGRFVLIVGDKHGGHREHRQ
jgi:hypothetical protein